LQPKCVFLASWIKATHAIDAI